MAEFKTLLSGSTVDQGIFHDNGPSRVSVLPELNLAVISNTFADKQID